MPVSHQPKRPLPWRPLLLQGAAVLALIMLLGWAGGSIWGRLRGMGIASGFDIFLRPAGIHISSPFLTQQAEDSYLWLFTVAFVNTLASSLISIALAFGFGLLLGVGLVAKNKIVCTACTVYVEVFRNIPLILQAVFWYTTITLLPTPRQNPFSIGDVFFLTNKGIFMAGVAIAPEKTSLFAGLCLVMLAVFIVVYAALRWRGQVKWRAASYGLLVCLASGFLYGAVSGWPVALSRPALAGFSYAGGIAIAPELLALIFSCVVFSSAYIAEIFRGGLQSVPRGQVEAAQCLGLPAVLIFLKIRAPIAFRSMIPALSNIFLFVVKATAIGAAIGYADLYAVTVVSIARSGQTIEFLFVMMAAYFILNYSITQIMGWVNRKIAFKESRV